MKNAFRALTYLCMVILLAGCCPREAPGEYAEDTLIQSLQYGEMNQSILTQLPWNSGRCEITSNYAVAETEEGFYLVNDQYLWYADKADMSNWVPVCNRPECGHSKSSDCGANIRGNAIYIENNRIFYLQSIWKTNMHSGTEHGDVLVSTALDGTDQRVEYILEDAISALEGGSKSLITPDFWMCRTSNIDADGNKIIRVFCVTDDGETEYPTKQATRDSKDTIVWAKDLLLIYGDPYFFCVPLGTDPTFMSGDMFMVKNNELVKQDISMVVRDQEYTGMYLSGNTLRLFRRNDGYYDRNLTTAEEVKLGSAQLKHSNSFLVLPNCVIETTLHSSTMPYRNTHIQHKMKLFDGVSWKQVELPKNLKNTSLSGYMEVVAVTSDSVLLRYRDASSLSMDIELYRIMLDTEKPVLQYLTTIQEPNW